MHHCTNALPLSVMGDDPRLSNGFRITDHPFKTRPYKDCAQSVVPMSSEIYSVYASFNGEFRLSIIFTSVQHSGLTFFLVILISWPKHYPTLSSRESAFYKKNIHNKIQC